jgi:signal transduction histidine kinase
VNLLIVDDYASNRKLLRAQLEAEGHAVSEAANGVEALQVLDREAVDAVISDILMPNMDGFRLCQEIRKSGKPSCGLPVILYTSTYNSPGDRQLAESVGADGYVLKPAPTPVILAALREAQRKATDRVLQEAPLHDETYVLQQYNEMLVRKLETRNTQLQETLVELRAAHDEIVELNRSLELRVEQRTAELNDANKELEAFSYTVSHDLRAPLRAMGGLSEVLLQDHAGGLDPQGRGFLELIVKSVERMRELIDALLRLSRVGRSDLKLERIDLTQVAREALGDLKWEHADRRVDVLIEDGLAAEGDVRLIRLVVQNLLENAWKYTRDKPNARIEIGAIALEAQPAFFVRDNGAGFDMKHAESLFAPFKRLHREEEFPGIGIGLATVQRIVARHGGRVWAEGAVDRGATFYFTLPAPASD